MAARKSCTHITWNEAKAKSGLLSSNTTTAKNNKKKISHGDALTAKVVAKHTGESNKTYHQSAQLERKIQRRQEERMAKITAHRLEMKERERAEQTIQPYEQAKIRIQHKLWEYATTTSNTSTNMSSTMEPFDDNNEWKKLIVECKQLQLEEISALEAIFMDTEDFYVTESSQVDVLQEMLDEYTNHDNDESLFQAIFHHPPLTMLLQQNLEDDLSSDNFTRDCTNHKELVISVLFRIAFPPTYPMDGKSVPQWEVLEFYVTDKTMTCSPDKPLESLASLQVVAIQDAWNQEAQSILPDPIVYHIIGMWFPEHVWDDKFLTMSYNPSKR